MAEFFYFKALKDILTIYELLRIPPYLIGLKK